jgi:hypothetical protein
MTTHGPAAPAPPDTDTDDAAAAPGDIPEDEV